MIQCGSHPIFGQSCLKTAGIGVLLGMIGCYYLITSASLSEAKLRTVCLELRICVLKWPLLESNLMSVNDRLCSLGFCTEDDGWCDKCN